MKVIAILENTIQVGGGFTQSLNAIIQMEKMSKNTFEFSVLTTEKSNLKVLKKLNIDCFDSKLSFFDKLFSLLTLSEIGYKFISKFKLVSNFEKKLKSLDCNLVYFISPSSTMSILQSLNYIATVWDSSHRDSPEFDEVRSHGEFRKREYIYRNYLTQAFLTLVDSNISKESLNVRYGLDKDKILVMPFSPNPFLKKPEKNEQHKTLKKYNLKFGYLFYPAQFWSHKNHLRILQSIRILKANRHNVKIVFSGGFQENNYYNKILKYIEDSNLTNSVSILGFVPSEDLSALYFGSSAVIFPSYLGPTNIPPLETWVHSKPLLCSQLHKEQVGKAAIMFNPDSSEEIAEAILKLNNKKIVSNLISESKKQISLINKKRKTAEKNLISKLSIFKLRLD